MNDIRRTVLWVIFGFSMVLLWDKWQIHNGNKPTFFPGPPGEVSSAAAVNAKAAASDGSVPGAGALAAAPAAVSAAPALDANAPARGERIVVKTDVLVLEFDTLGGTLAGSEFLNYGESGDKTKHVRLLDDSKNRMYLAQSGVVAGAVPGNFPTHKTPMAFSGATELKDGQDTLQLTFSSPAIGGISLVKTYTLRRGSYAIAVSHALSNQSDAPIAPQLYLQLLRDGNKPAGESSFYSTFTGPAVYTETKKYQKVEFAAIKKKSGDYEKQASDGYIAMVQHYFASAWILPNGISRSISMDALDMPGTLADCCYRAVMVAPVEAIAPGTSRTIDATLFVGPQEEKMLEAITPGLELLKDYGWLTILAKPLYWLLDRLHSVIQNWGWSIVALVLLLKIAFYWLNAKAYASMAKMKAVNPKIMEMRERLKDNPQQMQQEMMRIYREEKVNPMGGCFPIMVQIPVFIALYWVLLSTVEMRSAPWMGWIHDLSAPDPYFILPVVMTLTTLLQTALNPAPPDPMQAKMMWIMPLVFSVMFFFFPSGLVVYWITNNILSIAQQWIINTRMGVPPQFNLPKFN
jgi:YidC/Oxa1 family membrane protein insertase